MKIVLAWLYNRRSELVGATGTQTRPYDYEYSYDSIGNRLTSSDNFGTSTYAANCLNQYTAVNRTIDQSQQLVLRSFSEGGSNNFTYDADGNLTQDDRFTYTYDDENRLVSVTPLNPQLGSCAIDNAYDHRSRRIRKVVKHYDGTSWNTAETHVFVWDGWNIVLEKITFADNTTRTVEYFWGNDLSGSEQGAGGVGGLLAKRIDGVFYIPVYGANGNIMMYVDATGTIAAQYNYDPYGNILQSSGPLATQFAFGFSTKYHDREVGLVAYQLRTYDPVNGRWLNRDPIEEEGGINIYQFVNNTPNSNVDNFGLYLVPLIDPIVKQKMNETDDVANPKKQRAAAKFIDMYNVHQYFLAYKEFEEQFNNARSKLLRCCSRRGLKRNKICKLISDGHLQVYVVFRLVTKTNLDFANGSIFSVKGGNPGESVAKGIALLDMYDPGNGSAVPIFEYYDRFANIHGESLETLMFHELTHYNQLKLNGDHSAEKWEYACRAGTATFYNYGVESSYSSLYVADRHRHPPVGSKLPNSWGLYDMYGYVLEWCLDQVQSTEGGRKCPRFIGGYMPSAEDPKGPHDKHNGYDRVLRGGELYQDDAWTFTSVSRDRWPIDFDDDSDVILYIGFRVLMEIK